MSAELFVGVLVGSTAVVLAAIRLLQRARERRWAQGSVLELRIPVPESDVRVVAVLAVPTLGGIAGIVWLAMELRQKSVDAGQWAAALGIPLLLAVLLGASELAKAYYSPGRLRLDAERLSLRLSASEGSLWLQRPFQLRRWLAVDALGGSFYLVWDVEQDGGTVSFCYPARRKEANASPGRMITKPYGVFLGDGGREVMRRLVERAAVVER